MENQSILSETERRVMSASLQSRISAERIRLATATRRLNRSTSDTAYCRRLAEVSSISGRLHELRMELNGITNLNNCNHEA